uniref:Optic atrophy 3 protein n=1 Tax=Solanum tuberosum TaxID=4113 RepID=M1AJT8_SOLTU
MHSIPTAQDVELSEVSIMKGCCGIIFVIPSPFCSLHICYLKTNCLGLAGYRIEKCSADLINLQQNIVDAPLNLIYSFSA